MSHAIAQTHAALSAAPRFALPVPGIAFALTALALHAAPVTLPALAMLAVLALAVSFFVMRDADAPHAAPTVAAVASGVLLALSAALAPGALMAAALFAALSIGAILALSLVAVLLDGARGLPTVAHAVALLGGGLLGSVR